jgi:hypothetical protein
LKLQNFSKYFCQTIALNLTSLKCFAFKNMISLLHQINPT